MLLVILARDTLEDCFMITGSEKVDERLKTEWSMFAPMPEKGGSFCASYLKFNKYQSMEFSIKISPFRNSVIHETLLILVILCPMQSKSACPTLIGPSPRHLSHPIVAPESPAAVAPSVGQVPRFGP